MLWLSLMARPKEKKVYSDFHLEVYLALIEDESRRPTKAGCRGLVAEVQELRQMLRGFAELHGLDSLPHLKAKIKEWNGK